MVTVFQAEIDSNPLNAQFLRLFTRCCCLRGVFQGIGLTAFLIGVNIALGLFLINNVAWSTDVCENENVFRHFLFKMCARGFDNIYAVSLQFKETCITKSSLKL